MFLIFLADECEEVQKKSFTRWINWRLSKVRLVLSYAKILKPIIHKPGLFRLLCRVRVPYSAE